MAQYMFQTSVGILIEHFLEEMVLWILTSNC